MFTRAVRLTRIRGIEVRLDPTLPLFALLVVWTFSTRFGQVRGTGAALAMAAAGTVLFFVSILAHELAHALEARHRGLEVVGITLTLFGGVTEMHAHSQTPRDELVIAAVGPYVSLVCGAVFGLVATFAGDLLPSGMAGPVAEVAGLLGWLNVVLAVFNVVPGAPLDGGRMLRAVLWRVLGDRQRGVRVAARAGQVLAVAIIAAGVWLYVQEPRRGLFTAALAVLIGLFLFGAARDELRHSRLDVLFSARTVGQLVGPLPRPVDADQPLDLLDEQGLGRRGDLLPVVEDGVVVGVLPVADVAALHPTDRSVRRAGDLAVPIGDLPAVDVGDDLHTLVDRFQAGGGRVRLERAGRVLGALTEREVARAMAALQAGGRAAGAGLSPPAPGPEVGR